MRRLVVTLAVAATAVITPVIAVTRDASAVVSERWAGADRFATSVTVSQHGFPAGAPIAFIATATSFADALAAGPVAGGRGGPILLTAPDALPPVVATELQRLNPAEVVILGGAGAVAEAVELEIEALLQLDAVRLGGADRYETAAAVAEYGFATATGVLIASGAGFADALAAGPVGGLSGRPLLLTEPNSLSPATAAQLTRLANPNVTVLGGPSAISDAVVAAIDALTTGSVQRVHGPDRYRTSVALSQTSFTAAQYVILATGSDFPDALGAGPVAAVRNAPILLTRAACVTDAVAKEIQRLGAATVIVVGGLRAVSAAAANLTVCVPPPPPTTTTRPPPPPPPPPPKYARYCRNGAPIRAVNTSKRIITFTFDDGPWPSHTANVMSTFERYGWRASFFVIGSNVRTYPDIARSIVQRGHLIANHSMTHVYSPSTIAAQVPTTRQLIYNTTGVWTTYFRSPGLTLSSTINNAAYANNSCNISTDVDLGDWRSPRASASTLCTRFRNSMHPGMIVLLHDGGSHQQTVNALPCMLDYVRAAGYSVVPLNVMLNEGMTVGVRLQSALDGLDITE